MTNELIQDKTDNTSLKDLLAVAKYLKEKGFRIGKSSVYNHKKEGKLRPDPATGYYLIADVDKYASLHLERLDGTTKTSKKSDKLQLEKLEHETRKVKFQADQEEIEARKAKEEVTPVAAVNISQAAMFTNLKNSLANWSFSASSSIIQLVHGDPALEPDLAEFLRTEQEEICARHEKTKYTIDLPESLLDGVQNLEEIEGISGLSNG